MNLLELISVIREVCLYLATFGYFTVGMTGIEGSLLILGTAVLCCVLSQLFHPDSVLKYLPLLSCGLMFIRGTSGVQTAAAVPMIAYLFLKIRNGHWGTQYSTVVSTLKTGSVIYCIFLFFLWIYETEIAKGMSASSVPFFAAFLILSVYSMRVQRDSALMSFGNKYAALSFVPVLLIVLLAFLLTSPPARALITYILQLFGQYILYPLLMVFTWIMLGIVNILKYPVLWLLKRNGLQNIDESEMGFEQLGDLNFGTEEYTGGPVILDLIWKALPALLLLAAVIFIVRRISRNTGFSAASSGTYQREALTENRPKRRTLKDLFRPPLTPVREAYRQYLKLCAGEQIPADGTLASDEVLRLTSKRTGKNDAEELRKLWLPVRYGGREDTDGNNAKQLVKNIRKQFRENR